MKFTVEIKDADLKDRTAAMEPDERLVNAPVLVPGLSTSVGIVREASRIRGGVSLTIEGGADLKPVERPRPGDDPVSDGTAKDGEGDDAE